MEMLPGMTNLEVAAILHEVADLLDIKGVRFKPHAYRRAAMAIETPPGDVADVARGGRAGGIPRVGRGVAGKGGGRLKTGGAG